MGATACRHSLVWALVLAVVTVGIGIGESPSGAGAAPGSPSQVCIPGPCPTDPTTTTSTTTTTTTSLPSATTTIPTTTSTTVAQPSPYSSSLVPCGGSQTCDQTPSRVEISYQAGPPPAGVEIDWVANGRSAAAPNPDSTSVTLDWTDGASCGSQTSPAWCWDWPSVLTNSSFVLNGTYQIVPCGGDPNGICQSPFSPTQVGVAVRPGPPASVVTTSAGPQVTIHWEPPSTSPPDLVGYQVARNGRAVYTCSTDDLGPGAQVPCPGSSTVADYPGNGSYTYTVRSIRLGTDSSSQNVVMSGAATGTGGAVTVPGPFASQGGGGGGTGPVTTVGGGTGSHPVAGTSSTSQPPITIPVIGGGTTIVGDTTGGPTNGRGTVADPPANPNALALHVPNSPSKTDVVPVAVLALGILSLAIAAHFLFLKVELSVLAERLAGGRRRRE